MNNHKLTKSQRINAINDIAAHLSLEGWTTIDLTLKQFSLPISDTWSGDMNSYVIDKIENAKDALLTEMAQHFGIDGYISDVGQSETSDPPFWEEGKLKVFISHLTGSKDQASQIKNSLSPYGMSGFVAHSDIELTLEWQIEIESALSTCDLLVAVLHPGFVESRWCDQEVGYALGRGVPVFTVKCGLDPYGFVSRFRAFNGNGKTSSQIAKELFEASIVHKLLQKRMAGILMDRFTSSGTFSAAKNRIGYLENLKVWENSFSDRLKEALIENDQISGSWGVPARVEALIEKWV